MATHGSPHVAGHTPFRKSGWGYALFNYDAASATVAADPAPAECGHSCHQAVKSKDFIFHPFLTR